MQKVVHITYTPLAGAPIRIVNALNDYTNFSARLINYSPNAYGNRTFPEDLSWHENRDECLELISEADILHFHHWMSLDSANNKFNINFKKLAPKAKFLRHYHSNMEDICLWNKTTQQELLADKYPRVVIPHCPERSWQDAYIVPNIIPIHSELYEPKKYIDEKVSVFFSATSENSMWDKRWATKGLPEIKKELEKLKQIVDFDYSIITNTPYDICQKIKSESSMVIGDVVTGSYHLTDLESLALGKPTFSYLDSRTQLVLQNLLKCDELPFINTRLEELSLPFVELVKNKDLRIELGKFSRDWIQKYYDDKKLVKYFEYVYTNLLNNIKITRQKEFEFSQARKFLYNDLYDMQWQVRKASDYSKTYQGIVDKITKAIGQKKKVMFWGASLFLEDVLSKNSDLAVNVIGIIDKNSSNYNKDYQGCVVYPVEKLSELNPELIICTIKNNHSKIYPEIKSFLNNNYPKIELLPDIFNETDI